MAIPFNIDGFYPLYSDESHSNSHIGGDGTSHTHEFDGVTYYMPNGLDSSDQFHGNYDPSNSILSKKLKVTWKKPLHVNDTISIVLYRYKQDGIEPTCENMTQIGELVYETEVLEDGSFDDEVEAGTWHYAIYSKNRAGLSPCVIDSYEVAFDLDGDGVIDPLDLYPFNPLKASGSDVDQDGIDDEFDLSSAGIYINSINTSGMDATFSVVTLGPDITSWRYSIDGATPTVGTLSNFTLTLQSDGSHTILVEALDSNGNVESTNEQSFEITLDPYISITSIGSVGNQHPFTINVDAGGTGVSGWNYKVENLINIVQHTSQVYLLENNLQQIPNLNTGQRYKITAQVLDASGNILESGITYLSVPELGADYLWGTDIGIGQIGIPQPDNLNFDSNQGSYYVVGSTGITSQSALLKGGLAARIYTDSPNPEQAVLTSSIYESFIPEKWYHIVITSGDNDTPPYPAYNHTNKVLRMYVNSQLVSQIIMDGDQAKTHRGSFLIGASHFGQWSLDHAFNGRIDQPAVWGEALSQQYINDLYNNGSGLSYDNFHSDLQYNLSTIYEFTQETRITESTLSLDLSNHRIIDSAFGYDVKNKNDDSTLKIDGDVFNDHPITVPGGVVSSHSFTPCLLDGMRNGINPLNNNPYTSSELAQFYGENTRKVAALQLQWPGASPRLIPDEQVGYTVAFWMRRSGRAVGYPGTNNAIKGSANSALVSEGEYWVDGLRRASFLVGATGPTYEQDSANYWMYGK